MSKGFEHIYSPLLVIVHGKSEHDIFTYLKKSMKQPLHIYADNKGKKFNSIQITSLLNRLNKHPFNTFDNFKKTYGSIENRGSELINFKLFIVMDTDDCTIQQKTNFLNKEMFRGHWLFEYIHPIHNTENLESVLNKAKLPYPREKRDNYSKIFTQNRRLTKIKSMQLVSDSLRRYPQGSNLYEVLDYCISFMK